MGAEEFNPIRDRFFSSIPKIYDVNGTLIEDILSVQARSLREAQRAAESFCPTTILGLRRTMSLELSTHLETNWQIVSK